MRLEDSELRQRLRLGEDGSWEFKEFVFSGDRPRSPRQDSLADELAAFANARGGVLLCGVTDQGEVQGMERAQLEAVEQLVIQACQDSISPPITPNIERREFEGRPLVVVEVEEGTAQHDSPGGSFHRVGSSKREMTTDERLRLAQRRGQARYRWFDEQIVDGTGFETLSERLWGPLLSQPGSVDPRVAMAKMRLLAEDDQGVTRATVAGVLLCADSPQDRLPHACITATCYRGVDRGSSQIDAKTIGGPLDQQIREATAFVARNMRVSAIKVPGRVEMPQYSDRAVFEAVVNAVAHRDYSIAGSRIRLSMFEDRLEIQSPGGLPNNLTVDSMHLRQSTRNEVLVSMLGRMRAGSTLGATDRSFFMERRGDGVPIIVAETEGVGAKPPVFEVIDGSELRLTIPAALLEHSPSRVVVRVRSADGPLAGVIVLALFPNKTYVRAETGADGEALLDLYSTGLPLTVFAAAEGWAAAREAGWVPSQRELELEMVPLRSGGSVVFADRSGHVPGLKGRLNPIRDTLDRTYLYTSNVAVNEGRPQPVSFRLGEELQLTDVSGVCLAAKIIDIVGASALVEYRELDE